MYQFSSLEQPPNSLNEIIDFRINFTLFLLLCVKEVGRERRANFSLEFEFFLLPPLFCARCFEMKRVSSFFFLRNTDLKGYRYIDKKRKKVVKVQVRG